MPEKKVSKKVSFCTVEDEAFPQHSIKTLIFKSLKRSHDMFLSEYHSSSPIDELSQKTKIFAKILGEYQHVKDKIVADEVQNVDNSEVIVEKQKPSELADLDIKVEVEGSSKKFDTEPESSSSSLVKVIDSVVSAQPLKKIKSSAVATFSENKELATRPRAAPFTPKPQFHPHWKLYRVISGHLGWVRCLAFDPTNQWFCTGSNDRTVKIWDLASGTLKLSLTGHISHVRGLAVSDRHPYMFSAGEDKQVKCWDLECNKVIRHYHGHLLAVYDVCIHPTLNIIVTASRDATCRVWDMRTKACVHVLTGHNDAVLKVEVQAVNPQVITGSMDSTVKFWDLAMGKAITTLTNHKKSVRALQLHPSEFTFLSGSADNIKKWKFPRGDFLMNMDKSNSIVNTLSINDDNVLVAGADNGFMHFYDYKTGYKFQEFRTPPQSGSLESEAGIYALSFDQSGSRLVTCEADKTIKMYKEDDNSTEQTHPIHWKPQLKRERY